MFDDGYLIDMMFSQEPLWKFKKLWELDTDREQWSSLLHMACCEESYTSVGGDEGYLPNPPINHEYLHYLEELIKFLESKGLKEE